jgi:hypothetical protein
MQMTSQGKPRIVQPCNINMENTLPHPHSPSPNPDYRQAWEMALGQLRQEMERADFESWVQPLRPLSFQAGTFTLGAANTFARQWVEEHLQNRITRLLEGMFGEGVKLKVVVSNAYFQPEPRAAAGDKPPEPDNASDALDIPPAVRSSAGPPPADSPPNELAAAQPQEGTPASRRKMLLQRAYGSERARVIQPERTLFVTMYFFDHWLPLLGHSAAAVVLAARALCYWNPMTGELRNEVETEMAELAKRAAVSVRTVKDVLRMELVQRYFLRYRVRRIITSNGVRTAGITLLVRMDDPLTPEDQDTHHLLEEEHWYPADYEDETD